MPDDSQDEIRGRARSSALVDKVVLISGVGPGLGRATARAALGAGARVVLGDLASESLDRIAHELDASGAAVASPAN